MTNPPDSPHTTQPNGRSKEDAPPPRAEAESPNTNTANTANTAVKGDLLGPEDRILDDEDHARIAAGRLPKGSSPALMASPLAPKTLLAHNHSRMEAHLLKQQAKLVGDLEGFIEAHREQANLIYGGKMAVISGLMEEMAVKDGDEIVGIDTTKLDAKRLKVLFNYLEAFEKRAYGNPVSKTEHSGSVDVKHLIAQAAKGIEAGD